MGSKWYQKASVQSALITGLFAVIAATIASVLTVWFNKKEISSLQRAKFEVGLSTVSEYTKIESQQKALEESFASLVEAYDKLSKYNNLTKDERDYFRNLYEETKKKLEAQKLLTEAITIERIQAEGKLKKIEERLKQPNEKADVLSFFYDSTNYIFRYKQLLVAHRILDSSYAAIRIEFKNVQDRLKDTLLTKTFQLPTRLGRVDDFAKVFTGNEIQELADIIDSFKRRVNVEIVVLTIATISPYLQLSTYTSDLFDYWKIGSSNNDRGILFILAVNERKVRIEVGVGLESFLSNEITGNILDTKVVPLLRQGSYYAGLKEGVQEVITLLDEHMQPTKAVK